MSNRGASRTQTASSRAALASADFSRSRNVEFTSACAERSRAASQRPLPNFPNSNLLQGTRPLGYLGRTPSTSCRRPDYRSDFGRFVWTSNVSARTRRHSLQICAPGTGPATTKSTRDLSLPQKEHRSTTGAVPVGELGEFMASPLRQRIVTQVQSPSRLSKLWRVFYCAEGQDRTGDTWFCSRLLSRDCFRSSTHE